MIPAQLDITRRIRTGVPILCHSTPSYNYVFQFIANIMGDLVPVYVIFCLCVGVLSLTEHPL